jgi:hypothetical protein
MIWRTSSDGSVVKPGDSFSAAVEFIFLTAIHEDKQFQHNRGKIIHEKAPRINSRIKPGGRGIGTLFSPTPRQKTRPAKRQSALWPL